MLSIAELGIPESAARRAPRRSRALMTSCQGCGAGPDGTKRRAEEIVPLQAPPKPAAPSRVGLILAVIAAVVALLFGAAWLLFFR